MKNILFSVTIIMIVFIGIYQASEGGIAVAASAASSTVVTLTVNSEISLTCPTGSQSMGSISGITGGSATVDVSCNVKTSNLAGYSLTLTPTSSPALVNNSSSTISFANYTATSTPDYAWSVAASAAQFGFAVSSTDVSDTFRNNGVSCGGGANVDYAQCYRGFDATTAVTVASRASATAVTGTTTTVRYKAESGVSKSQPSGTYTATVTVTATTL